MIPVGYKIEELIGSSWEEVIYNLQVSILGDHNFSEMSKYPYNFPITVKYHKIRLLTPPMNYKDEKNELRCCEKRF